MSPSCFRLLRAGRLARSSSPNVTSPTGSCWPIIRYAIAAARQIE